jgi:hypothetical protein
MLRLTILVARCRQLAELYAFGDHVGLSRQPTKLTLLTTLASIEVPLGVSSWAPLLLRLLCWIPDKLALSRSLAGPLTTVPWLGPDSPLAFQGWRTAPSAFTQAPIMSITRASVGQASGAAGYSPGAA